MKTSDTYLAKNEFRVVIENTYPELIRAKREEDKESFNQQLLKIIPKIRKYIDGRLSSAIRKGHFPIGKYKADEFIDQLFIETYDHIEGLNDEKDFYLWLFKKTNELLDETIVDEEFDDHFFKNIDAYNQAEWNKMRERFSAEADGDLVMMEDLDDTTLRRNEYILGDIFLEDNEKALMDKLDRALSEEEVDRHINMVLHHLPMPMRTVFELATDHHLELEEITQITKKKMEEVVQLLKDARKALQVSIHNAYPSD